MPNPTQENLSNIITLRVSSEIQQALAAYAAQHNATISEVIRAAITQLIGVK